MQIAGVSPTSVRTDPPTAPATREEAAQALAAVPMGLAMVASMTAMTKTMAGEQASRADLVAPMLEKLSPEAAKIAILNAIDGAIAVMPELEARNGSLREAAAGVQALLVEAAADTAQGDPQVALQAIMTRFEPVATPLLEAVKLLDPNFGNEPAQG